MQQCNVNLSIIKNKQRAQIKSADIVRCLGLPLCARRKWLVHLHAASFRVPVAGRRTLASKRGSHRRPVDGLVVGSRAISLFLPRGPRWNAEKQTLILMQAAPAASSDTATDTVITHYTH